MRAHAFFNPAIGLDIGGLLQTHSRRLDQLLAGTYAADPTLTGKANFGFVSKYQKGQSTPDGNTEFQFKAGDLNFHSSSYEWLVIAHHKATYKGIGTINGEGNYGFMISAIDEELTPSTDVDLFRIKIWDKNNGNAVVYDNQLGAAENAVTYLLFRTPRLSNSELGTDKLFTGQRLDPTGSKYYNARYYDAEIGRFIWAVEDFIRGHIQPLVSPSLS